MNANPISAWWRDFTNLIVHFFGTMGPREYSTILVLTFIGGYLFLRGGIK